MKKLCLIALLAGFLTAPETLIAQETEQFKKPTNYFSSLISTIEHSFLSGKAGAYEHLKNIVKQIVMKVSDLREASPELRLLAEEALQASGIIDEVIILESNNMGDNAAYVQVIPPFKFLVTRPLSEQSNLANNLWILTHEAGHLYHNHSIKRVQTEILVLVSALLFLAFDKKLHLLETNRSYNLFLLITLAPVLVKSLLMKYFARQDEKEADLFACKQLIKHNKVDSVLERLAKTRTEDDWHPAEAERKEYIQQCLLDHGVSQETISAYIEEHGRPLAKLLKRINNLEEVYSLHSLTSHVQTDSKLLEKVRKGDEQDLSPEEVDVVMSYMSQILSAISA